MGKYKVKMGKYKVYEGTCTLSAPSGTSTSCKKSTINKVIDEEDCCALVSRPTYSFRAYYRTTTVPLLL